jgi:phosphopantothenoylcysteine decarboxylase/phosphopantothenate--cysteine ligase
MSRVLVAVSGGIAAYKASELVRALRVAGHEVRVIATENALRFVSPLTLQTLSGHAVRSDLFSLTQESEISHIELADWAEVVFLATRAAVIVAPAMNVNMYRHPATQANLDALAKRGVSILGPEAGELACGWEGEGRLVDLEHLQSAVERALRADSLRGEVVLVTAGPTSEPIDPVRVIVNRSSGKMGFALAAEASRRGAEVILVSGPCAEATPPGVQRIDVETAAEMREAVLGALDRATIVIKAAAVADYRVAETSARKLKTGDETLQLSLVRNPDILAEVGARKGGRTLVGFAAETHDLLEYAREKLVRKGCDLIVANDVSRTGSGIGADRNEVSIVGPGPDDVVFVPEAPKAEVARCVLDRIEEVRQT